MRLNRRDSESVYSLHNLSCTKPSYYNVWHPRCSVLIFLFPWSENDIKHIVPQIDVWLPCVFAPEHVPNMRGWMNGRNIWLHDYCFVQSSLPPCSQYVTIPLMCQMERSKVQKTVGEVCRLGWREWNNWAQKKVSLNFNSWEWAGETRRHVLVRRRWQNNRSENVGGGCGEKQFFLWQVCVGWWLPVLLLLLYTLVCKPPLTSGVIFLKTCLQTRIYVIALMWYCIVQSLF